MNNKEKFLLAFALLASISAGFLLGRLTMAEPVAVSTPSITDCQNNLEERRVGGGYKFINPLLECDNYQPSQLNSVVDMERSVQEFIRKSQDEKKANFVSVYFRDLNFGPWMGINEKESFSPASLLKVPIMIAALKKAETDPTFLHKKILYTEHLDKAVVPNITDPNLVKIGHTYTIEDLMERMIRFSDNEAKEMILRNLDQDFIIKVMSDIGINTQVDMSSDFVSVKDYSGFFRLLYNATYLNRNLSEKALDILSRTSFDKGIMAGLPKGVTVSHKFGERAFSDNNIKQLHECGIVYVSGQPYLLCVMTRGNDFNEQASVIAGISSIVYKNIQDKK